MQRASVGLLSRQFPAVECASGTWNFYGDGWWYHAPARLFGLTTADCGFVTKTTTMSQRDGNMPLKADGTTPVEWMPRCITVRPFSGDVLNSVGLSNPGFPDLYDRGIWQRRTEPFWISFGAVCDTKSQRLAEVRSFVGFLARGVIKGMGVEYNASCPNIGHDSDELVEETGEVLDILGRLDIPVRVKLSVLTSVEKAKRIADHRACCGIVMSNTIPFGKLAGRIPWESMYGQTSPLEKRGFSPGGLSGPRLLPLVLKWIEQARESGIEIPIWGCGGVYSSEAVERMYDSGASGVQLGTVFMLRPWRTGRIIRRGHELFRR